MNKLSFGKRCRMDVGKMRWLIFFPLCYDRSCAAFFNILHQFSDGEAKIEAYLKPLLLRRTNFEGSF